MAEVTNALDRRFLVAPEPGIDVAQAELLRLANLPERHCILITKTALDRDRRNTDRVFVQVWPGEGEVGLAQLWRRGAHEAVRLGEECAAAGLRPVSSADGDDRRQVHPPLHRHRGYLAGKVEHVTDDASWQ